MTPRCRPGRTPLGPAFVREHGARSAPARVTRCPLRVTVACSRQATIPLVELGELPVLLDCRLETEGHLR